MADNTVVVTLIIRNAPAANWTARNPVLHLGEYGVESDTLLIKMGDGVRDWTHLPYLNKLHSRYFTRQEDGSLTFNSSFAEQIENLIAQGGGGDAHLIINDDPEVATDPINYDYLQRYVANAIQSAGHLKRQIVLELPSAANADENTLYMVPASSGNYYEEYMVINGAWDKVGETGDGGNGGGFELQIATASRLGGVKSSSDPNTIAVNPNTGIMTLNQVSTSLLYVPTGDTLTIDGGNA